MRRAVVGLAVTAGLLALPGSAAAGTYCSPTGDYCYEARKRDGVWRISYAGFPLRGRITVCVRAPDATRTCRRFRLRSLRRGLYGFDIRWSRHFPDRGPGRYRVAFRHAGATFGPGVSFRR